MKKRFMSFIIMFFLAFSIMLTGCGDKGLKDNPDTQATVVSNGGMSVVKGDYLYFVNGYVDETTLTINDNKEGKVTKGALYRTKLDSNEISKDDDGFLNNSDRVVSKIVGFSNGGFRIIDDYIFYATPCMTLIDSDLQNHRVEFYRVNIDGTKGELIYTTSESDEETLDLEWSIYKIDNNYFLVVSEGSKLITINASTGKVIKAVENISTTAILEESEYVYSDTRDSKSQTHVYYTRAIDDTDNVFNYNGNVVCALNIATGETEVLEKSRYNTYNIKHVTRDAVYYDYTSSSVTIACMYKKSTRESWSTTAEMQLTDTNYDSYFFSEYSNDVIIATKNDITWLIEGTTVTPILQVARTIIAVYGNYAYYVADDVLVRVNIYNPQDLQQVYDSNLPTLITNENFIDFDNRRVFVYASYTAENGDENYYLTYFKENCTTDTFNQRFVGVFESDDLPEKPEQPEPEYEGDEVEYVPHID